MVNECVRKVITVLGKSTLFSGHTSYPTLDLWKRCERACSTSSTEDCTIMIAIAHLSLAVFCIISFLGCEGDTVYTLSVLKQSCYFRSLEICILVFDDSPH